MLVKGLLIVAALVVGFFVVITTIGSPSSHPSGRSPGTPLSASSSAAGSSAARSTAAQSVSAAAPDATALRTPTPMPAPTATPSATPTPTATATPSKSTAVPANTPSATASVTRPPKPTQPAPVSGVLFSDHFSYPSGLITNEYAYWNKVRAAVPWELTSGSLFEQDGTGWSGVPDAVNPDQTSSNGTDSAVFRLNTKSYSFQNVSVTFSLLNQGLSSTARTPPVAWDGVHVFLRYQSEYHLYYASVNRRDNTVIIKKKVPGGPSNGGTYYDLSPSVKFAVPYGQWQQVQATVRNNPNGTVTIQLFDNGRLLVSATDSGVGGPPITAPGATGIRGDNCDLRFDNFVVRAL